MTQKTHICEGVSILSIVAIEFTSETQPLKIVSRCARTTCGISWGGTCSASYVARLTHVFSIGVETRIALEFTTTTLQFHDHLIWIDSSKIALGAGSIRRSGAFQAFSGTWRALLVDHIGEFVVWAVIDTSGSLQEEAVLTFLAWRYKRSGTFCAIWMTLNAHSELWWSASNVFHRIEVTIFTVSNN